MIPSHLEWSVGDYRERWTESIMEKVTRGVTCCISDRSSQLMGNSCTNSASNRYRWRESHHPEEGTVPHAKWLKLKAEVWMSNDDCNPNDRLRSWVIRLSKQLMKNQSSMVLTAKKRHCHGWKKLLPTRMIILMLLGDQLNSTKSLNPTSTGETAGDKADNIWFPILSSYWKLIQRKGTQVNRE